MNENISVIKTVVYSPTNNWINRWNSNIPMSGLTKSNAMVIRPIFLRINTSSTTNYKLGSKMPPSFLLLTKEVSLFGTASSLIRTNERGCL